LLQDVTNSFVLTLNPHERQKVYSCLLRGAARGKSDPLAESERWDWLMAAHVVGQHDAALHLDCHRRMASLARESGDWSEFAGQVLRIALLPLGHLLGRVPEGNIGRASVGVARRMVPPEPVQVLIDWAVLGTRIPGTRW
jgi:hypothetical protein